MSGVEESPLVENVLGLLASAGVEHRVLRHAPVFTSEEAARTRGTALEDGAKALICHADEQLILIVVPADRRLDTRKFKQIYLVKNLRMAAEATVEALGAVVGGVPPFGHLMGLQTYADEGIGRRQQLSFNAGSRTTSVMLSAADYLHLERPIVGSFAS